MPSLCEENAKRPDSSTVPFRNLARPYLRRRRLGEKKRIEFFIKTTIEPLSGWPRWLFSRRLQFPAALMSHLQEKRFLTFGARLRPGR